MVKYCVAEGCTNGSYKDTPLSFHKFPSNAAVRAQWIAKVNREKLPLSASSLVLCSAHFEVDAFDESSLMARRLLGNFRVRLKPDAVPTIFNNTSRTGLGKKQDTQVSVKENIDTAANIGLVELTTDETMTTPETTAIETPKPRTVKKASMSRTKKLPMTPSTVIPSTASTLQKQGIITISPKQNVTTLMSPKCNMTLMLPIQNTILTLPKQDTITNSLKQNTVTNLLIQDSTSSSHRPNMTLMLPKQNMTLMSPKQDVIPASSKPDIILYSLKQDTTSTSPKQDMLPKQNMTLMPPKLNVVPTLPKQDASEISPASTIVKRRLGPLTSGEKSIVLRVFDSLSEEFDTLPVVQVVRLTADTTGVSAYSVLKACDERVNTDVLKQCDGAVVDAVCVRVRELMLDDDHPTLKQVLEAINGDPRLPNFKQSSFLGISRKIGSEMLKLKLDKLYSSFRNRENVGEDAVVDCSLLMCEIYRETGLKLTEEEITDLKQIDENVNAASNCSEVKEVVPTTTTPCASKMVTRLSASAVKYEPKSLTEGEIGIVLNVFDSLSEEFDTLPYLQIVRLTSDATGVPHHNVFQVCKERNVRKTFDEMKRKDVLRIRKRTASLRHAVHAKVRKLVLDNETPTITKVLEAVNSDIKLPYFERFKFIQILNKIGVKFITNKSGGVGSDSSRQQQEKLIEKEAVVDEGSLSKEAGDENEVSPVESETTDSEQIKTADDGGDLERQQQKKVCDKQLLPEIKIEVDFQIADEETTNNMTPLEIQNPMHSEDVKRQCSLNDSGVCETTTNATNNYKETLFNDLQNIIQYISNDSVSISLHTLPESGENVWEICGPKKKLIIKLQHENEANDAIEPVSIKKELADDFEMVDRTNGFNVTY